MDGGEVATVETAIRRISTCGSVWMSYWKDTKLKLTVFLDIRGTRRMNDAMSWPVRRLTAWLGLLNHDSNT